MVKTKIKRAVSFVMATVLSLSAFMSVGTSTAFAASGEKTNVYMVDFPRDGDANYDGVWGHSNLTLKNGWHTGSSTHTNLKAIGSYSGNIAYCIEPGVSLSSGQSMNKYDENYFNNITANGVISGDEIRLFIGRILQYGYRGTISTSWRSQNESAANSIAHAYANISAFSDDSSFALLSALEVINENGELERKADMFFKRTIKPHKPVEKVDTASEALAVSMGEKAGIDMEYMSKLTGKNEETLYQDLKGVIFLNPLHGYGNVTEAKYLMENTDEMLSAGTGTLMV